MNIFRNIPLATVILVVMGVLTPVTSYACTTSVGLGSTGDAVSCLQRMLTITGDYTYGEITGYFGPVTETAVQRFQTRQNIVSSGTPSTTGYGNAGIRTRLMILEQALNTLIALRDKNSRLAQQTNGKVSGASSSSSNSGNNHASNNLDAPSEVDVTKPTVTIQEPAAHTTLSGVVTIKVNATDDSSIDRVVFRVNGSSLGVDRTEPYSLKFDSTKLPDGQTSLVAVAYDTAGNVARSIRKITIGNSANARRLGAPYIYKTISGVPQYLYIQKPENWKVRDARPAVVFFHGGAWVAGQVGQFEHQAKHFVRRGMVAIMVDYRLAASGELPDKPIMDAKSAMRWVRENARKLGVDPNRIAAAGGSAGGHLAAFASMVSGLDDPKDNLAISSKGNLMVLFNPVLDNGPDDGWRYNLIGNLYPQYSPAHNISPDDPRAIILTGDQDELALPEAMCDFRAKMNAIGVTTDVMLYVGARHGFFNSPTGNSDYYYDTLYEADRFFVQQGWLHPDLGVVGRDVVKRSCGEDIDTVAPTATIIKPLENEVVSGTIPIVVTASDDVAVEKVAFWIGNSTWLRADPNAPYRATWDTTSVPNGQYSIVVIAHDTSSNIYRVVRTVTVQN